MKESDRSHGPRGPDGGHRRPEQCQRMNDNHCRQYHPRPGPALIGVGLVQHRYPGGGREVGGDEVGLIIDGGSESLLPFVIIVGVMLVVVVITTISSCIALEEAVVQMAVHPADAAAGVGGKELVEGRRHRASPPQNLKCRVVISGGVGCFVGCFVSAIAQRARYRTGGILRGTLVEAAGHG